MDDAIKSFLSERKADRIKKKTSAYMTEAEIFAIEQEANDAFLLGNWLPDAARRAGQLSLVSHPGKFSHPSAKISSVIAESKRAEDGFLRTGNANAELDVFGNAAAMDVFKFLSLVLSDGQTILEHLDFNSEKIKSELSEATVPFEELRAGLLSLKKNHATEMTSERVKQIYFPVLDNYHLLSILTPSGLMFELRNRIQTIRFAEEVKKAKEDKRKNAHNDVGFDDLYGLSMIGYGGTKPQNISVLNSTYGGKAYLLPSVPPILTKQNIRLPKSNFFTNSLRPKNFEKDFSKIHNLFNVDYNNKSIRDGLRRRIQSVIDDVIEQMWVVRSQTKGWSADQKYAQLLSHQKIWLDESRQEERQIDDNWFQKIIVEFARWFIAAYKKVLGKQAILLGDAELSYIKSIIEENKEDLR